MSTPDTTEAAALVSRVLDALWTGNFPDGPNAEKWLIDKLRDAMTALGVDWTPPPTEGDRVCE